MRGGRLWLLVSSWRAGWSLGVVVLLAILVVPAMGWVDGVRRDRAARLAMARAERADEESFRLARLSIGAGSDASTLDRALTTLENSPTWAQIAPRAVAEWRETLISRLWERCDVWDPRAGDATAVAEACLVVARRTPSRAEGARQRLEVLGPALRTELGRRVDGAAPLIQWRIAAGDARTWGIGGGYPPLTHWSDSVETLVDGLLAGSEDVEVAIDTVVARWADSWGVSSPSRLVQGRDTLTLVVSHMAPWHTALYRNADWRPRLRAAGWTTLRLRDANGALTLPDTAGP